MDFEESVRKLVGETGLTSIMVLSQMNSRLEALGRELEESEKRLFESLSKDDFDPTVVVVELNRIKTNLSAALTVIGMINKSKYLEEALKGNRTVLRLPIGGKGGKVIYEIGPKIESLKEEINELIGWYMDYRKLRKKTDIALALFIMTFDEAEIPTRTLVVAGDAKMLIASARELLSSIITEKLIEAEGKKRVLVAKK